MKINALISLAHAKYRALPHNQRPIVMLLAVLFGIVLIVLLFKGCMTIASSKKNASHEPIIVRKNKQIIIPIHSPLRSQITITSVKTSAAPHIVSIPGVIEALPSRTVNILPQLTGHLIALNVKLGDMVKRHQTLAVIRSPGLAQAYADRERARSIQKLTREALNRARRVNRVGANSVKDIELAENNDIQALAELNRAEASIKVLGKNSFSLLNIKAPIDGQVTALNYGFGSYINDQTTPLFTLSNINSVSVAAYVPEHLASVVAKELPVEVFLLAYPTQVWHSKVSFVNSFLDPDTRRNKTRITLANPDKKLQPNMFATVNIAIPQPDQIIIPISSVLMNNDSTSVYIERSPWTFVRREIELGTEDGKNVRVIAGLNAGDRIVTSGGVLVND